MYLHYLYFNIFLEALYIIIELLILARAQVVRGQDHPLQAFFTNSTGFGWEAAPFTDCWQVDLSQHTDLNSSVNGLSYIRRFLWSVSSALPAVTGFGHNPSSAVLGKKINKHSTNIRVLTVLGFSFKTKSDINLSVTVSVVKLIFIEVNVKWLQYNGWKTKTFSQAWSGIHVFESVRTAQTSCFTSLDLYYPLIIMLILWNYY